jgi:hypothetical protein
VTADAGYVSLKEYIDRRVDDLGQRMVDRFVLNATAVAKAELTMNDRLNSMNEFREALKDAQARMATRAEMDKIDLAVRELQQAKANFDGRLVVFSGGISVVTSLILWGLTRLVK